jgi:hypothetical protein
MKNSITALLLAMFLIWDYEPGVTDKLEMSFNVDGPWSPYAVTLVPENGVYRVPVPAEFRSAFFRVKREIAFDIKQSPE